MYLKTATRGQTTDYMMRFVTALYEVRPGYWDSMFAEFLRLLEHLEGEIYVWTDRDFKHPPFSPRLRIHVLRRPLAAFETWSSIMGCSTVLHLPAQRNADKDTLEYIALMNCKAEMIWSVVPFLSTSTGPLVWIDAGIMKIFKGPTPNFKQFQVASYATDKVTAPGCWSQVQGQGQGQDTRNSICWRFCGGILVVPPALATRLYNGCRDVLTTMFGSQQIAWEVNVWAELEARDSSLFEWRSADHNERILMLK